MARTRYGGAALLAAATMAAVSLGVVRPHLPTATAAATWWHPGPLTSWQYAIGEPLPIAVPTNIGNVEAYDIDEGNVAGTSTSQVAASVGAIHAGGAKAICYVETGGWESYRSDASEYSSAILGSTVPGYTDERYLDIRQWSDDPGPTGLTLGQILTARFQLCKDEGFDGVETDLDDTYADSTGFPLTMANELTFMTEMAGVIHGLGMAWFLKNDINGDSLIADIEPLADGTVNEQCWQYEECSALEPFVQAGKPVLNVEYANEAETTTCPEALAFPMATMHTDVDLDGTIAWACWQYGSPTGTTAKTTTTQAGTTSAPSTSLTSASGGPAPAPTAPPAPTTSLSLPPTTTQPPVGMPAVAPHFISPSRARATVGRFFSFRVRVSGNPWPTLHHSRLPKGLRWARHGRGTAIISGTPQAEAAGLARVSLSALSPSGRARQVLVVRVQRRPGFLSGVLPAATVGRRYHFVLRSFGYPVPSVVELGRLPAGVILTRDGHGVATVSGRPAPGTQGAHRVTVRVFNSLGSVTDNYVLRVVSSGARARTSPKP